MRCGWVRFGVGGRKMAAWLFVGGLGLFAPLVDAFPPQNPGEQPRAWATHRQGTVEDRGDSGICDEGNGAPIEGPDEPIELGEASPVLLEGNWNVIEPTSGGLLGQINVLPGLMDYEFSVAAHFGVCERRFKIVGIENGEEFVITGPCLTEVGRPVKYVMKLVDPETGDPEEPSAGPIESVMGGEFHVREAGGGSGADIELLGFNGPIPVNGVIRSSEYEFTNAVEFQFVVRGVRGVILAVLQ